jgi:hypothetical protein
VIHERFGACLASLAGPSTSPLGVMDQPLRQVPPDRSLAVWAGAWLGGTMLIGVALMLLALLAASPVAMVLAHPLITVLAAAAAVAFVASLKALGQLRYAFVQARRRLWYRSLICNVIVVAIVVGLLGAKGGLIGIKLGLVLCLMELIAIVLHLAALSLPSVRT